jgi:hypothetical protein
MFLRLPLKLTVIKKCLLLSGFLFSFIFSTTAFGETHLPKLFLFLGAYPNLKDYQKILTNPCVTGVQIIYSWKALEPKKGIYDFSEIEKDLNFLNSIHKNLFIQIQDRSFQPNIIYIPDYMKEEKNYEGGVAMQFDFPGEGKPITEGWAAKVWEPQVRDRFQQLIKALANQFDGKIYGINLPETAVDFDSKNLPKDFTPDKYFSGELENIGEAKKAFHKSIVIQYVNFFPNEWNNDHHYMSSLFSYAIKNQIGLGVPDVVPYRKSQMKNSYPFYHQYKGKIAEIGMAIQEPDYTYKNSVTHKSYNFSEFYFFAKNYLGATIIFWNTQEPFFSKELKPNLNSQYFECAINT